MEIVKYGSPVLRQKAREIEAVDDKLRELAVQRDFDRHVVAIGANDDPHAVPLAVDQCAGPRARRSGRWTPEFRSLCIRARLSWLQYRLQ